MIFVGDPASWLAIDSDDDQLLDQVEWSDGLDPGDRDSDDDGLLDGQEGGSGTDTDGDGVVNALDSDCDNDGLPDGLEAGVLAPDPDTDLAAGFFRADLDPLTTTDPFDADTDDGGAADGAEDRNADGAVDAAETDPENGSDDPACAGGSPPEIAAQAGDSLTLARSGNDLTLSWGDVSATEPCILYRVYGADDPDGTTGKDGFDLLAVSGAASQVHAGSAAGTGLRWYLVVGATLGGGEGSWGHFEP
jgi:hypothetical protein